MSDSIFVNPGNRGDAKPVATKIYDGKHYPLYASGTVSTSNSTSTLLTNGSTFTGAWEDVGHFDNVVVSVKTDQNGTYTVQFSPDGVNADSTLTRYYRTTQIEAPHKFTITRQYCRVTFTNDSGSDQTYLRLQTLYGSKAPLNVPLDANVAADYDATVTRPTDFFTEVGLGRRQGHDLWNKFGFNKDVSIGTEAVVSWGGTYTPSVAASTLSIVSTAAADDSGSTGVNQIIIYGIDANWDVTTEIVTMDGTTPVVTTSTWIGINRVAIYTCGSGAINAGDINVTKVTGGQQLAQMPAGEGVTQQTLFFIPRNTQFMAEWMLLNAARNAANNPYVTFKFWVYSALNSAKQKVFELSVDTEVENTVEINPTLPFPITEKSIVWIEATTDQNATEVNCRYSGILTRDVDF